MPVTVTEGARWGLFYLINQICALLNSARLLDITYGEDEGKPLYLY